MFFDGALSCEGAGAGVLFVAPEERFVVPFSYRLQWDIDYTNNVCEYKALVLGLEASRRLKIKNLEVYGDAELIVKQINRQYQAKHPRLRSYRNCASGSDGKLFLIYKCPLHPTHKKLTG
jgi:ribonuclease HI